MPKTNVRPWAIIAFVLIMYLFGIGFSIFFIGEITKPGLDIGDLLGFFFFGFFPVFTGTFVLINYFRGKDYSLDDLEGNAKLPLFVKLLRLFFAFLMACIYVFMFVLLKALEKNNLLPIIVVIILEHVLVLTILAAIFLGIGKVQYFRNHKNKQLIRTLAILLLILLYIFCRYSLG